MGLITRTFSNSVAAENQIPSVGLIFVVILPNIQTKCWSNPEFLRNAYPQHSIALAIRGPAFFRSPRQSTMESLNKFLLLLYISFFIRKVFKLNKFVCSNLIKFFHNLYHNMQPILISRGNVIGNGKK